jgi:hypothetical protein
LAGGLDEHDRRGRVGERVDTVVEQAHFGIPRFELFHLHGVERICESGLDDVPRSGRLPFSASRRSATQWNPLIKRLRTVVPRPLDAKRRSMGSRQTRVGREEDRERRWAMAMAAAGS